MSIEHMDNWAIYGGEADRLTDGVYIEKSLNGPVSDFFITDPDPLATGSVLRLYSNNQSAPGLLRYALASTQATVGMALRIWMVAIPNGPAARPCVAYIADNTNTLLAYVAVTPIGGLAVYNSAHTELANTNGPVLTANAWFHVETNVFFNGASSTVECRVEGAPVLTATGLSLGSTPGAQVSLQVLHRNALAGDNGRAYYKDVVVWNGAGTQNNNFLGSVVVYSILPNADTTLGGWTSTGANGFSVLDNAPPLDGTSYLSVGTPPQTASVFTLGDLPSDVTTVRAVMSQVRARKIDGGDGSLQVGMKSGAATGLGANRPITAAFTYWRDVFEIDPNTTAQL